MDACHRSVISKTIRSGMCWRISAAVARAARMIPRPRCLRGRWSPPGARRGRSAAPRPPIDPAQPYPAGVEAPAQRYFTDYGLGYPYLLAPPWSSIMAYDLNRGVIKWKRPLGQTRAVAGADGEETGVPRGAQRQGMIVTSTGIVFSTARDGRFYAFDADNGDVLWSAALPMGSEGLPAIYAVGKQALHRRQCDDTEYLGNTFARKRRRFTEARRARWIRGVCAAVVSGEKPRYVPRHRWRSTRAH